MRYILPRLIIDPQIRVLAKDLLSHISVLVKREIEELVSDNFIYIFDYTLRKVPSNITLDTILYMFNKYREVRFLGCQLFL